MSTKQQTQEECTDMVQRRPAKGPAPAGKKVQWVARWYGPDGREKSKSFPREKDAALHEKKMNLDVARGTYISPDDQRVTVGELVQEWIDEAMRESTRGERQQLLNNLGDLRDTPVGKVKKSQMAKWVNLLRNGRPWAGGRTLSESTITNKIDQIRGILHRAVDDGIIVRNPARDLKRLRKQDRGETVKEWQVPSTDQVRAIIRATESGGEYLNPSTGKVVVAAPSAWVSLAVRIAVETGLRPGEVTGLVGGDVDVEGKTVRVALQTGDLVADPRTELKTPSSGRRVPITGAMARELAALGRGEEEPIICGGQGFGATSGSLGCAFVKFRRVAGVPESITMHSFRHYYASRLLAEGVPTTTVAALLGHSSMATTATTYAHFMPETLDGTRAVIRALAGSVRDDAPDLRVV